MHQKITPAPEFFLNNPVVFSFEKYPLEKSFPLAELVSITKQLGLIPMGVKGANLTLQQSAIALGLAYFSQSKTKTTAVKAVEAPVEKEPTPVTKVIQSPIRSGQQIYSPGDLIVMAQVSAGAELLAGGNILIYGPLRGRALAGVNGNDTAHIMCFSQEAELVAIGGHYLNDEKLKDAHWRSPTKIYFNGDKLIVEKLAI